MSDLWVEATYDVEGDEQARKLVIAREAVVDLFPFLAEATTHTDFTNRKALVADRLDAAARQADPGSWQVVRQDLEAAIDADFVALAPQRRAKRRASMRKRGGQNLIVVGPNLPAPLNHRGDFHVHDENCQDLNKLKPYGHAWPPFGYDTQQEVVEDIFSDILDENQETWEAEEGQVYFAPCVGIPRTASLRKRADTCDVCGDTIEKDPAHEDPQTWHHDNGEKHDHEATPSKGEGEGDDDSSKESRRRTAEGPPWMPMPGDRVQFGPREQEGEVIGPDESGQGIWLVKGADGWANVVHRWDMTKLPDAQKNINDLIGSRRTAGVYCKTHDVWVGEGNADTHGDDCDKEQRATEKTKDARRRRATRKVAQEKYPDIEVQLVGNDGNAFAILGSVQSAMRRAGVPKEEITAFFDEATSGDYNHLLQTCMKWVKVSSKRASRRKTAGERRLLRMPFSEVNMHMQIAGKDMWGELTENGLGVQLYDLEGNPFSFPIGVGEAGWGMTGADHTMTDFVGDTWYPIGKGPTASRSRYPKGGRRRRGVKTGKAYVTTRPYLRSHGKEPKGEGGWAFQVATGDTAFSHELVGEMEIFYGTYAEARKQALEHFKDAYLIAVLGAKTAAHGRTWQGFDKSGRQYTLIIEQSEWGYRISMNGEAVAQDGTMGPFNDYESSALARDKGENLISVLGLTPTHDWYDKLGSKTADWSGLDTETGQATCDLCRKPATYYLVQPDGGASGFLVCDDHVDRFSEGREKHPINAAASRRTAAKVTQTKANQVLKAIEKQFKPWIDAEDNQEYHPFVEMDYEGGAAIIWESGAPYDWTLFVPYGGRESEFGFEIPSVTADMPTGVFVEPWNGYVLGLFADPQQVYTGRRKQAIDQMGGWQWLDSDLWVLKEPEGEGVINLQENGRYIWGITGPEPEYVHLVEGDAYSLQTAKLHVEMAFAEIQSEGSRRSARRLPFGRSAKTAACAHNEVMPDRDGWVCLQCGYEFHPDPFPANPRETRKTAAGQPNPEDQYQVTAPGTYLVNDHTKGLVRTPLDVGQIITFLGYRPTPDWIDREIWTTADGVMGWFITGGGPLAPQSDYLAPVTGRKASWADAEAAGWVEADSSDPDVLMDEKCPNCGNVIGWFDFDADDYGRPTGDFRAYYEKGGERLCEDCVDQQFNPEHYTNASRKTAQDDDPIPDLMPYLLPECEECGYIIASPSSHAEDCSKYRADPEPTPWKRGKRKTAQAGPPEPWPESACGEQDEDTFCIRDIGHEGEHQFRSRFWVEQKMDEAGLTSIEEELPEEGEEQAEEVAPDEEAPPEQPVEEKPAEKSKGVPPQFKKKTSRPKADLSKVAETGASDEEPRRICQDCGYPLDEPTPDADCMKHPEGRYYDASSKQTVSS